MKTNIIKTILLSIILQACAASMQQLKLDQDNRQIYALTYKQLSEYVDNNFPEKIQVVPSWIKSGQDMLEEIITQPIGAFLKQDVWKFVLQQDRKVYHPTKGNKWVSAKNVFGSDLKIPLTATLSFVTTPIVFNDLKDKAYLYYNVLSENNFIRGPVLLIFLKENNDWKLLSSSIPGYY